MRAVVWLVRAFVFFVLFAFALNNQHAATVYWFFGLSWQAPLVIVVLAAFAGGAALGVLAMLPSWWRARRTRTAPAVPEDSAGRGPETQPAPAAPAVAVMPPREVL